MLRKFFVTLSVFFVLCAPAVAAGQCTTIHTTDAQAVTRHTKGYEPVALYLHVYAPKGNASAIARHAFFTFWIQGWHAGIRRDRGWNIQEVQKCSYGGLRLTLIKVRSEVFWNMTGKYHYVLGSALLLPKSVVHEHPQVGTKLRSGVKYVGTWSVDLINRRHVATIDLAGTR